MITWSLFVLLEKTHSTQREQGTARLLIMPVCEFKEKTPSEPKAETGLAPELSMLLSQGKKNGEKNGPDE